MKHNNVAKHAHLAGRAGVHESSGKHYRRTNQKVLDLEYDLDYNTKYDTNEYYTDYIEDEFIEENEDDE